jgi:(1->4)-alpha-D-glucan 1-alpha-D-glucosylmutase
MRIPKATYRIQFNPSFGFKAAKAIASYLADLGISDIYASPILRARKGSTHGYDVVDFSRLNPELGSMSEFEELTGVLKEHKMGWLQDIVPNHMAYDYENWMLMDVLENGTNSEYVDFFDIDWNHPYESLRGRLLAPFLGKFYAESLESGEIKLHYDRDGFSVHYYHLVLPLKIESYIHLLTYKLNNLRKKLGGDYPDFVKLLGVLYALRTLPSEGQEDEWCDQVKFIKRTLWGLYQTNREIRGFMDGNVDAYNGGRGDPERYQLLDSLLGEQLFRLSYWKVATEEINYRRFFNINELVSLRIEDDDVFERSLSLVFSLIQEGRVTGLRIDHIDGLYDPTRFLRRIREKAEDLYLIVEKICDPREDLPTFWPVQGTTGYDFLNYVNGLLCKKENEKHFSKIYSAFTGFRTIYDDLVSDKKRLIMGKHMAGDIDNLARLLKNISSRDRYGSDITIYGLKRALVEMMAHFPVYRTYVNDETFRKADHDYIRAAANRSQESNPGLLNELRFIERFLLRRWSDDRSDEEESRWLQFMMRFQQFTGPLMAKGFEDTTLYVYNRLLSLNEVGGAPETFGMSLDAFHQFCTHRASNWPHSMNATSTHDTKRGEDVRARINVLSEIPREWEKHIRSWSAINRKRKKRLGGLPAPDKNDEYFLYQTLIGSWPFSKRGYAPFVERIKDYLIKAVREAKLHTAWLKPDTDYEEALLSFIEEILDPNANQVFLDDFVPFSRKIAHYAIFNSLSQTLIKITAPGVPDFYQGAELWDLNLVDPDNRRPVDFDKRRRYLQQIRERTRSDVLNLIHELLRDKRDGRIKLFLIHQLLKIRDAHPQIFQNGDYVPLEVAGAFSDHIMAFARNYENRWALAVAPRFLTSVIREGEDPLGPAVWSDTSVLIPPRFPRAWRDVITNQPLEFENHLFLGDALRYFPTSMLFGEDMA